MGRSAFIFAATLISVLPGIATAQGGKDDGTHKTAQVALWAGISVPRSLFNQGEAAKLQVSFAVVNDGNATVDPKIGASHLSINGVEPEDWNFVINNGIRSSEFNALPPGHVLSFGYMLGDRYFAKPGIYTVRWWGESFTAAPITFRVLPDNR